MSASSESSRRQPRELEAMAARLAYRGRTCVLKSGTGCLFRRGSPRAGTRSGSGLCLDANGSLYSPSYDARVASRGDTDERTPERELRERGTVALNDTERYFALAHWDHNRTRFRSQAPQGFKKFYYVELPGRVAFASDYKLCSRFPIAGGARTRVLQTYLVLFSCPAA